MSIQADHSGRVYRAKAAPSLRYTLQVDVGGGAVHAIPNPAGDLEWMLRYSPTSGLDDKRCSARLSAASVISDVDYLCSSNISMAEATRRLRILRSARRAATRTTK